jgi:hypothetical protein
MLWIMIEKAPTRARSVGICKNIVECENMVKIIKMTAISMIMPRKPNL